MPIYVYAPITEKNCVYCANNFEVHQPIESDSLTECPECHAPIHRVIQAAGVRMGKKYMLTDENIKRQGFTKLVNEGGGKFRKI